MAELSLDQTRAMLHGIGNQEITWTMVELPQGPQDLPPWLKGAWINWHEGYDNSPDIKLKVTGDVTSWKNLTWAKDGSRYSALHPDGRAQFHYHSGALSKLDDDTWQTTKSDGYGGRHFPITLADGRKVTLRGPWHSGATAGFVEVHFWQSDNKYNRPNAKRPWYNRGGYFGLFITEDLWLKTVAKFYPHLSVARVTEYGGKITTLQPIREDWYPDPKPVWQAHQRAQRA